MRALRWFGREDLRLENVESSSPIGRGMVEIAVSYCGICGSDIAEYRNGPISIRPGPHVLTGHVPPVTLGHEFSGNVVAVGQDVAGIQPGDRVSADACWRCGSCKACVTGFYNHCALGGSIGLASDGAMADKVQVPAYCVVHLPDKVSDKSGALLEPFAVGLHAIERANPKAGQSIAILGFGPIGVAAAEMAQAAGLQILIVEPNQMRRERAIDFGYQVLVPQGSPREVATAVRSATDGGVDVVIEASGVSSALEAGLEMTLRGGKIVMTGIQKEPIRLDAARLLFYERALIGSLGYAHDLPRVASMIAAGLVDAERCITRIVDLEDARDEIARLSRDPGADLKVLIRLAASS